MKHIVRVKINSQNKSNILLKLNKINVGISNVTYEKKALFFDINTSDLKRVKKYLISYKVEVVDEIGIYKFKRILKKNMLFIVSLVFSILVFLILSNIIVKVQVIHDSKELRNILYDALEERGVKPLSFKKSYDEYEAIILEIKEEYKDKIEWLEIDVEGMVVNIRVEERIINNYEKEYNTCHIVASKSGIVKDILTTKGVTIARINDFVNKGEILISGEVKLNEEVKNNVCASGEVMAEVWYNVKVSIPLSREEIKKTGKMRYNFMLKDNVDEYMILNSRVKEAEQEKKKLFKILGKDFYIVKEYEIEKNLKQYTEEEAITIGINEIHEKLNINGIKNSDIITEKVLKKSVNNDTLDMDMFIAVKEQIGVKEYYKVEMDSGTSDNKDNTNINGIN